jgi:hypothetical protein
MCIFTSTVHYDPNKGHYFNIDSNNSKFNAGEKVITVNILRSIAVTNFTTAFNTQGAITLQVKLTKLRFSETAHKPLVHESLRYS